MGGSVPVGSEFLPDLMTIQGKEIETRLGMLPHTRLHFFMENPRIYSIVREEGRTPTEDDIQEKLEEMEHVRALIHDIKKHNGLIDAVVVKDGTFEVVEGNSRLAAYRVLSRQNPAKWALMKCRLLPEKVDPSLVAALLGQWHLRGKKEWPPYEQAGYLYRRRKQLVPLSVLAAEAGISTARVEKIVEAYQLMIDQGDTKRDRWSYYDEFIKSRKITKVAEEQEGFKERVLGMVKAGKFERAQDLRDKLPVICAAPPRVRSKFAAGKIDFDEAYDAAVDAGGDNTPYQKLRKFRLWLASHAVQDEIADANGQVREKIEFELRKLETLVAGVLKRL
jgi:hypothetical protein